MDNAKALAAGLELCPFADPVRSVLDSVDETPLRSNVGLAPEREAELLDEYAKR